MKYFVDSNYREKLSSCQKKLSRYEPLFPADTQEYSVALKDKTFKIRYKSNTQSKAQEYDKKQVRRFDIFSVGCAIIFKDKKYVFIPVTENDEKNEFLIDFSIEARRILGELKIGATQRLALPDGEGGRYHVGTDHFDAPWFILIVVLLSALMGYVFFCGGDDYKNVTRKDCTEYTGTVVSISGEEWYEDNDYCEIEFEDGEIYTIDGTVISEDVQNAIKTVKADDTVTVLFYEDESSVMEVTKGEKVILPFEWAYKQYNTDAQFFFWTGIVIWAVDLFLFAYGISGIIREKKEKE